MVLRIEQSPKPLVKKLFFISQINPNETRKVVFKDMGRSSSRPRSRSTSR